MPVALLLLLVAAALTQNPATAALRAQAPGTSTALSLDFEFFRTKGRADPPGYARGPRPLCHLS